MTHIDLLTSPRSRPDTHAMPDRDRPDPVTRWLSDRAWSRAGAVARVLATGPTRRALALTTRIALLVSGALLIGCAVAVMLWDELGPGPLDVLIAAVRDHTGLPLAVAMWLTICALIAIASALGRRPGAGTLLAPILIGPMAQVILDVLAGLTVPGSIVTRTAIHVAAIGAAGLGAGALIVSGLGAGTGELLAAAASDRSGHSEPRVRLAFEAGFVAFGVLLGGPFGLGTMLVVVFIGPAVDFGFRLVDAVAGHIRARVVDTVESVLALAG